VTAHGAKDDQQSLWTVKEGVGADVCEVGTGVRCGDTIQLQHVATGKNLHSHHFKSPISNNQEVSGFGEEGRGNMKPEPWSVSLLCCAVTCYAAYMGMNDATLVMLLSSCCISDDSYYSSSAD